MKAFELYFETLWLRKSERFRESVALEGLCNAVDLDWVSSVAFVSFSCSMSEPDGFEFGDDVSSDSSFIS